VGIRPARRRSDGEPVTLATIETATNSVSSDVDMGGALVNIAIFA
jgi:hypothetical protein